MPLKMLQNPGVIDNRMHFSEALTHFLPVFPINFQSQATSLWSVSQLAATALVTAFWQGLAVATGVLLCLRLTPKASAGLRFLVWSGGFLVMAALSLIPFLRLSQVLPSPSLQAGADAAQSSHPWLMVDIRWSVALAGFWLVASLYRGIGLVTQSLRLRRLWKTAVPVSDTACPLGKRSVQVCITRELDRPGVIGFLSPRILIPDWLMERLTADELHQIVLHESEHLRRRDDWTNLLQKIALVVCPINPVLFWVERQLCLEREMACDEGVVRRTQAPRAYAACLTSLAERGLQRRTSRTSLPGFGALALGAWRRRPELVRRVQSILLGGKPLGAWGARGLLAAMAFGLAGGAVELARCPQLIGFAAASPKTVAVLPHKDFSLSDAGAIQLASLNTTGISGRSESAVVKTLSAKAVIHSRRKPSAPSTSEFSRRSPSSTEAVEQLAAFAEVRQQRQVLIRRFYTNFDPSADADSDANPRLIILTTWQTEVDPASGFYSDMSAPDSLPVGNRRPNRPTALLLRVVPKSFALPQPGAVSMREGWFILQL